MLGNLFRKSKKEEQSQRLIFEMFYERVYSTAYFITKDRYLAQDIAQETFIKAFNKIDTLHDGKKMGAWLGSIAARTSIDFIRKTKRWNDIATEDVYIDMELSKQQSHQSSVEKAVELKFVMDAVYEQIDKLKPEYKQVVVLKYEYGMKDSEIAEALDLREGTVKSRLHRSKAILNKCLRESLEIKEGGLG